MEFISLLIAVALTIATELLEMLVFKILKDGAHAINGVTEEDMVVDTVKVLTTLNHMDLTNTLIPQNHSISNRITFPLVHYISLLLLWLKDLIKFLCLTIILNIWTKCIIMYKKEWVLLFLYGDQAIWHGLMVEKEDAMLLRHATLTMLQSLFQTCISMVSMFFLDKNSQSSKLNEKNDINKKLYKKI